MSKTERVAAILRLIDNPETTEWPPEYEGFFICFNAGEYYEAHDVLEALWLRCTDTNRTFYKGLIQTAGAFVHLKKQYLRPDHPVDGARLPPAVRLFKTAIRNLTPYGDVHLGLDLASLLEICREYIQRIESCGFSMNPWTPERRPIARLDQGRL